MKHNHSLLAACMALAAVFGACTSELENPEVDITAIRCNISQIDVEENFATGALDTLPATKAVFSGANFLWSAGDKIGIVPTKGAQIYFSVDKGAGTSTASFDGGDWAMKSTGTFYAYYPLYPDIFLTKDHVSVSYTGQTQQGNNNNLHTGDYWTLYTGGTTAVGNVLDFSFDHLTSFFKTYVTVPAGTYNRIAFTAPSAIFIKDGYIDLDSQTPKIVGTTFTDELCLDLLDVTFTEETELTGYLVVAPVDISGIPITVTVYKDGEAAYTYTLTKTSPMEAAKTYAFRATTLNQVVPSVTEANALFASGITSVTVSEPLTEDATVVLPNTDDAVTLTLPTTPSSSTITVSYAQDATACPATLSLTGPGDANLNINAPNSTVTVNGVSYNHVVSRTETNIISIDVTIDVLKVIQGDVQVYGTVRQIDLSEQEDDAIIYSATGTVNTLLGEDDEEYIPATGLLLNKSSMSLSIGASEALTATVMPYEAYPRVVWGSSDETVATVSADGLVTAVAGGSATITAKTISGGFTASCIVTVNDGSSSGTNMINYYACGVFSDHTDIYLFGDNVIGGSFNFVYGTGTLKKNWYSAVAFIGDDRYELAETDGFSRLTTYGDNAAEEVQYGKYTWCWAFRNTTVQDALKVASTMSPVTIVMTDVNGIEYTLVYTKPQTSTKITTYYKYEGGLPSVGVSGVEISPESMILQQGATAQLTASVLPENASNRSVTWTSSDESVVTVNSEGEVTGVKVGTATITCMTNDGGFTASCAITVNESIPSISVPEAIDMGLPSGLKWASFNLGASAPEEYGDYYAWGDTEPYYSCLDPLTWKEGKVAGFGWSSYSYGNNLSTLTKYVTDDRYGNNDDKTVLEADDDAATTNWGSTWRTPTDAEWTELMENCTWTWTNLNGVKGRLVTAVNGNSIFLPAAGYVGSTSFIDANSQGRYWSSSLYTSYSYYAWCVDLSDVEMDSFLRCYGLPIRPVYEDSSSIPVTSVFLNRSSLSLTKGSTGTLTATVIPSNATNKVVTWTSSDESVATVSSSGVITGINEGVAVITAQCDGVATSCTVDIYEPVREDFNPNSYLLYRANKTIRSGNDYYEYVSELPGLSGSKVELKFQLEGPGLIGNVIKVTDSYLRWTTKRKVDGEWESDTYEHSLASSTSLVSLKFDGVNHTFSVNGESIDCPEDQMSLGDLVTSYEHESDEGIWEVHTAEVPDNSKLYYVKAWDANGVLSYIGYATTSINPATNKTEYCWCSYYPKTGQVSYDFANAAASQGGYEGYTYSN